MRLYSVCAGFSLIADKVDTTVIDRFVLYYSCDAGDIVVARRVPIYIRCYYCIDPLTSKPFSKLTSHSVGAAVFENQVLHSI